MLVAAIINLSNRDSAFSLSIKSMTLQKDVVAPMIRLSGPVMIEKAAFSFGKVVVNSMSGQYGPLAVGALGISNNIGGITTGPQLGMQESGAAIISQNLGANHVKRSLEAFKRVLVINLVIGVVGMISTLLFLEPLSFLFANSAKGVDKEFQDMIMMMYRIESIGSCIPLGVNAAVISMLLGFGYTKFTLLINFCRVFLFRVPVLWALQEFTSLGAKSCGIVMLVSNAAVSVMSAGVAFFVIRKICREHKVKFFK
jgi:Na+-driven multidrug efflux pump